MTRTEYSMKKTGGRERQRVRALTHASYKFSFCCFFCRRVDVECERGGDKLLEQIICDISRSSGADKRGQKIDVYCYINVYITYRNFTCSSKRLREWQTHRN